jgi:Domain of unknown function (DUF222)
LAPTFEGMVALDGLLEPEAGQTLLAALASLARPANAADERSACQRHADALTELARRTLEGGQLPHAGGVRPQLTVVVDLDRLLHPDRALGGELGWLGPLAPKACRRLACDSALTRVLVTRHPSDHDDPGDHHLGGAPANPWIWAAPPGWSPRPNAPRWPCVSAAVSSPTASGPWPGARPTT